MGFTAAVLLVLLIGILSYQTFQKQAEASDRVRHTYQVLNTAGTVEKLLIDLETGRIRYRSTGAEQFLVPYNEATRRIKPVINELKGLTADNSDQYKRVMRIASAVEPLLTLWHRETGDEPGFYDRQALVDIVIKEKAFTQRARNELDQIVTTEKRLLTQQEQQSKSSIRETTYEIIAGTLFTLSIVLSLIYVTVNELRGNRKAEASLQENYKQLEHLNRISIEKNWLLTGMSVINDSLQDITDVTSLTQSILKTITEYLSLPASAFYCYDETKKELQLIASIALPGQAKRTYQLSEGLVGQAALERSLTLLSNVPTNFWTIQAGSGEAAPGQVACLPLWYNKKLKGVMEFASFRPFSEQDLLLLKSVTNNVAVAINAADYHEKVVNLLQQVQDQKKELENQQEELQQSNDQLVRQAKVLQMSEQELRVQEEELRQMNAELIERNTAIDVARKELTVKAKELKSNSDYKSEFLANMSHELRTPLNSVLILARLLAENKQHNLTIKQVEHANIIHKSGTDLLELINDILDLSKIEAGKIELLFEPTSTASIIEDMNQLFSVVADEKNINLSTQIGRDVPAAIWTDRQRLGQIIKNILSNAFKFTPRGGSVDLSLTLSDRIIESSGDTLSIIQPVLDISVTDTGIGISSEKQQIIFDAFQQVDGSISRKFGGTGLGLSISKELVRRLGGEFNLRSEIGKGSTFTIYLPLTALPSDEQSRLIDKPKTGSVVPLSDSVKRIRPSDDHDCLLPGDKVLLIIEDDPIFAGIIQEFARERNFKTLIALQGDDGLQYARQYIPSAIILDMGLPVLNGWDLLDILKSEETLKHIPVHVISAIDGPITINNDIVAYTNKPVDNRELEDVLTVINNHLGETGKKVLVLSGDCLTENSLKTLIEERGIKLECDYVNTVEEAQEKISQHVYDCIVIDVGQDIEQEIANLYALQESVSPQIVPFIIYVDNDLSVNAEQEQQLNKISNMIIRDSCLSKDRLMDEFDLFFHKVQKNDFFIPPALTDDDALNECMRGRKVLLVDDDMRNVFALSALLEANQMIVVTAGDGHEAIEQLGQNPDISMVLIDMMMPEMDGYEATRRIRTDRRFINLPIIAVTARAMISDREKCIVAGASDYISKPVDNTQLLLLLRGWLSRAVPR